MCPAILDTEERCLGGMTFFAQSHPSELCGSNGLPLTPNSITIYGKSQYLKTIHHSNLSTYLDIIRSKHGMFILLIKLCCIYQLRFLTDKPKWNRFQQSRQYEKFVTRLPGN